MAKPSTENSNLIRDLIMRAEKAEAELTKGNQIERLSQWAKATGNWQFSRDLDHYTKITSRDDFNEILRKRQEGVQQ